jgi:hypothetical protein
MLTLSQFIIIPILAYFLANNFEKLKNKYKIDRYTPPTNPINYYLINTLNCVKCISFQISMIINLIIFKDLFAAFLFASSISFLSINLELIIRDYQIKQMIKKNNIK